MPPADDLGRGAGGDGKVRQGFREVCVGYPGLPISTNGAQ